MMSISEQSVSSCLRPVDAASEKTRRWIFCSKIVVFLLKMVFLVNFKSAR